MDFLAPFLKLFHTCKYCYDYYGHYLSLLVLLSCRVSVGYALFLSARSRRAFPSVRPTLDRRVCEGTALCRREVVVDHPFIYFRDRSALGTSRPSRLERCTRELSRAHAVWLSLDLQPASLPIRHMTSSALHGGPISWTAIN